MTVRRESHQKNPDNWASRGGGSTYDENWQPPAPTPTPNPTPDPSSGGGGSAPVVPAWKNMQARIATLLAKAGMSPEAIDLVFEGLSTGADFIPGVGNLKALVETIVGFDLVTGKKFKWYERLMSGISMIIPGAAALKNGLKAGLKASKMAVKAERTIEAENDIMKVEELSESALQRSGKAVESCNCFVGGTKVKTDDTKKSPQPSTMKRMKFTKSMWATRRLNRPITIHSGWTAKAGHLSKTSSPATC
jgi:hypothetical protein